MLGRDIEMEVVIYDDMRRMALQNASDLQSRYDIVSFDIVWRGEFADKKVLRPLDNLLESPADRLLSAAVNASSHQGRLYGLPIQPHAELLWIRRDRLASSGKPFPSTTVDLLELARQLHDPEQGRYGIAWNAQRGQPLGQTMAHLFASFGQPLLDAEGRPAFDTPRGLAAAEYALDLLEVSPPDILTMAWDQRTRRFAAGDVAMTYGWGARAYRVETDPNSNVKGRVVYGPPPHAPGAPPVTPLGVWSLGVPANLADPGDAVKLLQWLFQPESQERMARLGNTAPPMKRLLADPDLQKKYPVLSTMDTLADQNRLSDAMRPAIPEWDALCAILGTEFHDMLLKRIPPEEALDNAFRRASALLAGDPDA